MKRRERASEREIGEREREKERERNRERNSLNEMLVLLYIPFSMHRYMRHPSMCNPRSGYLPNT